MTTDHKTGIKNDQSGITNVPVETDNDILFSTGEFERLYSQYKRAGYELAATVYQQDQLWPGSAYSF